MQTSAMPHRFHRTCQTRKSTKLLRWGSDLETRACLCQAPTSSLIAVAEPIAYSRYVRPLQGSAPCARAKCDVSS